MNLNQRLKYLPVEVAHRLPSRTRLNVRRFARSKHNLESIRNAVSEVPGVELVEVNHISGSIVISHARTTSSSDLLAAALSIISVVSIAKDESEGCACGGRGKSYASADADDLLWPTLIVGGAVLLFPEARVIASVVSRLELLTKVIGAMRKIKAYNMPDEAHIQIESNSRPQDAS